ncbi:biotin transporter BioY [Peptostreptococcus equinus]|uniref:Biotin transporter n=1 Tax=Peptostreptococcus equinus TaxID=3003601 RepID=A0ABY7JQY1_9FIRM|nr:biotin transporter BioY [Peptostreptococcus sp. CBA3647]WAW14357.1 biotin transporter BioY [Peptostreptococcus sp. CBA3647]
MKKNKLSVREITYIGLFAAIICVLSPISIPMPYGVPMTLQTFIIPLAGVILGAKQGTIANIIYLLLGAIGLPVFAGFSGGMSVILGPTGGFLISFQIMAFLAGLGVKGKKHSKLILFLLLGAVVNFLAGMIVFSIVTSNSISVAFTACVLPFIPTTIIKILLIDIIGLRIKTTMPKMGVQV